MSLGAIARRFWMMIDRALGFVSWLLLLVLRFVLPLFSPGKENRDKKRKEKGIYKIRGPTLLPQDGGSCDEG